MSIVVDFVVRPSRRRTAAARAYRPYRTIRAGWEPIDELRRAAEMGLRRQNLDPAAASLILRWSLSLFGSLGLALLGPRGVSVPWKWARPAMGHLNHGRHLRAYAPGSRSILIAPRSGPPQVLSWHGKSHPFKGSYCGRLRGGRDRHRSFRCSSIRPAFSSAQDTTTRSISSGRGWPGAYGRNLPLHTRGLPPPNRPGIPSGPGLGRTSFHCSRLGAVYLWAVSHSSGAFGPTPICSVRHAISLL